MICPRSSWGFEPADLKLSVLCHPLLLCVDPFLINLSLIFFALSSGTHPLRDSVLKPTD